MRARKFYAVVIVVLTFSGFVALLTTPVRHPHRATPPKSPQSGLVDLGQLRHGRTTTTP